MRIGYYQMNPKFGKTEENRKRIEETLRDVEADIVVLPELPVSGYFLSTQEEAVKLAEKVPGPTTELLQEISSGTGTFFVTGLLENSEGTLYNSAVVVGPDGPVSTYRKVHLFYEENKFFRPGRRFEIFDLKDVKIGMLVCFDHLFPEAARTLALMGAQIICHPSNLVLPEIAQVTTRVRALENRVFWVMANRYGSETKGDRTLSFTGESQIIGPDGKIVHRAGAEGDELFITDIQPEDALEKNITPYNNVISDRRPDVYVL